jgi:uncharacterized membrane protein
MFTLEMEDSIVIDRPVKEVFAYMDDIENEHEWQPYLREWTQQPNRNENSVGTERRYVNQYMGRRFVNVYVVTEYEAKRRVMYESTSEAAVQAIGGQTWEAIEEGATKVTFIFRPELGDFWGSIPKPLVKRIYGRTLKNNMKRLKEILENRT